MTFLSLSYHINALFDGTSSVDVLMIENPIFSCSTSFGQHARHKRSVRSLYQQLHRPSAVLHPGPDRFDRVFGFEVFVQRQTSQRLLPCRCRISSLAVINFWCRLDPRAKSGHPGVGLVGRGANTNVTGGARPSSRPLLWSPPPDAMLAPRGRPVKHLSSCWALCCVYLAPIGRRSDAALQS